MQCAVTVHHLDLELDLMDETDVVKVAHVMFQMTDLNVDMFLYPSPSTISRLGSSSDVCSLVASFKCCLMNLLLDVYVHVHKRLCMYNEHDSQYIIHVHTSMYTVPSLSRIKLSFN